MTPGRVLVEFRPTPAVLRAADSASALFPVGLEHPVPLTWRNTPEVLRA